MISLVVVSTLTVWFAYIWITWMRVTFARIVNMELARVIARQKSMPGTYVFANILATKTDLVVEWVSRELRIDLLFILAGVVSWIPVAALILIKVCLGL